jgi:hypothetical protein
LNARIVVLEMNDFFWLKRILIMFSSQACSVFHHHQKLSPCRWSTSGRSITTERGSASFGKIKYFVIMWLLIEFDFFFLDEPLHNPSQFSINKKAHPKRHLVYAIISSLLFFVTGKSESLINKERKYRSHQLIAFFTIDVFMWKKNFFFV